MAKARKCDICGDLYPSYGTKINAANPNSLRFLNRDDNDHHWAHDVIDCCPNCMKSIQNLIKELKGE